MLKEHDKIAYRLGAILCKLNDGETVSVPELAEEFGVSQRTIQKDLNDRLVYLHMTRKGGLYSLKAEHLGKYQIKDIQAFAQFSNIGSLYPNLDQPMVSDILNDEINHVFKVKGHSYENLSSKQNDFDEIGGAIKTCKILSFSYKQKQRVVQPYRLVNINGIWYLAGVEEGMLKHYSFSKINHLSVRQEIFEPDEKILEIVQDDNNLWFTQELIEVKLFIAKEVAEYFLRRTLLPHQLLKSNHDDGITITTKVAFEEEVLRIVRYWMPHITILSPQSLQDKLHEELKHYLKLGLR